MPGKLERQQPVLRPDKLNEYYSGGSGYWGLEEEVLEEREYYNIHQFILVTDKGPLTIDYYRHFDYDEDLIFVFPILGGSNKFAKHFAEFFADNGYDIAIVHRNSDFKRPENIDKIEELFRDSIIRDRLAMDFFEQFYAKKNFGSFGISRGAINVAMTAGVDSRLKYNVLAMGGSDLVEIFKYSNQKGIRKYRKRAMANKKMSLDKLFEWLAPRIKSDPKYLAKYIDPKDVLMFLAIFDRTVPISSGLRLRRQLDYPDTIFLFADHYTSLLYTQFVPLIPPDRKFGVLPFDYIERESLEFFNRKFGRDSFDWRLLPFRFVQLPFRTFFRLWDYLGE